MNSTHVIFAVIAMRDVDFFLKTAEFLKKENIKTTFISFFQPGNQLIRDSGYSCYDFYEYLDKSKKSIISVAQAEKKFNIKNLRKLLIHEKLTFEIYDTPSLESKFIQALLACEAILQDLQKSYSLTKFLVIQELGGFIAPLSLFYSSRHLNINHFFLEPSPYQGKILFVPNTIMPLSIPQKNNPKNKQEVEKYIQTILNSESLVIPEKDRHHFQDMGLKKLFNRDNSFKIIKKLIHKYIKSQRQEYEHIYVHCKRYIKMFFNRLLLAPYYQSLSFVKKSEASSPEVEKKECFVYFPLHVPIDCSLTVRSPEYLDQLSLVETICQCLPHSCKLYIKEHPAQIGAFSSSRLKTLIKRWDNLVLLSPKENNIKVIKHSDAVITINSKSGFEAMICDKKVITLGKAIYGINNLVIQLDGLQNLDKNLVDTKSPINNDEKISFLSNLWDFSSPCELYNLNEKNVSDFVTAIKLQCNNI